MVASVRRGEGRNRHTSGGAWVGGETAERASVGVVSTSTRVRCRGGEWGRGVRERLERVGVVTLSGSMAKEAAAGAEAIIFFFDTAVMGFGGLEDGLFIHLPEAI